MVSENDHSFIICAFRESPFLEECIRSLKNQEVPSKLAVATSTPNSYIEGLAEQYELPVYVNTGKTGIAGDWNFALRCADTPYVTLAHQDDVYLPEYSREALTCLRKAERPILFSSNYAELRNGEISYGGMLIRTKKLVTLPMRYLPQSKKARGFALAFGNGICCPTVTYVTEVICARPFKEGMKSNLDWERWAELSELEGSFLYSPKVLMLHRIHEGAETSRLIGEHSRTGEDYEMFLRFHTKPVARLLSRVYANGERAYKL